MDTDKKSNPRGIERRFGLKRPTDAQKSMLYTLIIILFCGPILVYIGYRFTPKKYENIANYSDTIDEHDFSPSSQQWNVPAVDQSNAPDQKNNSNRHKALSKKRDDDIVHQDIENQPVNHLEYASSRMDNSEKGNGDLKSTEATHDKNAGPEFQVADYVAIYDSTNGCRDASTEVENLICFRENLSRSDKDLKEKYNDLISQVKNSDDKFNLSQSQDRFQRDRSNCASDYNVNNCLEKIYRSRLAVLENWPVR